VGNVFRRTPKFNLASAADGWQNSVYRLPVDGLALGELALCLYSLVSAGVAVANGNLVAVPFILLYAFGFGYVSLQGLWEARIIKHFKVERPTFSVQRSNPPGASSVQRSNV
jgi:hypothetical protein